MIDPGGVRRPRLTPTFERWLHRLRDRQAFNVINNRLTDALEGNFGDCRSLGGGLLEMRIHLGPGYRLYFIRDSADMVVFLCGGDKDSQRRDIDVARQLARDWR